MLKKIFDRERGNKDFKDKNEEGNICNKNGDLQSYSALDTSVNKLRRKYTSFKAEWLTKDIGQGKTRMWISTRERTEVV